MACKVVDVQPICRLSVGWNSELAGVVPAFTIRCNRVIAGRLALDICIIGLLEGGVERRVGVDAPSLVGDPNTR
jgi:hypothetical protein